MEAEAQDSTDTPSRNFIQARIDSDIQEGTFQGRVATRFPPEPNGFLHIGHAKSLCLNFGLAEEFKGTCNLRFDDTNPQQEDIKYVESIIEDLNWMGFNVSDRTFYASDYFETLYEYGQKLIQQGDAYVCDLTADAMREYRGTITTPGTPSPNRDRSPEENLDLFEKMRQGDFSDGEKTLRAKIDMSHPNLHMRDPVLYRINRAHHYRQGDQWCIYPTYDFTHGQSDSIENITHSLCTLEFEIHRPLYDWLIQKLGIYQPVQIEFARLNLTYTMLSKRRLLELVEKKIVRGWDDPRMPTLTALRRRGYTPSSIKNFCERIGIAKFNAMIDVGQLEFSLREELNKSAARAMAVLNPLKVTITNYPEGSSEECDAINNPGNPNAGTRKIPFSKTLYIERDDFMEDPPKKFFRLGPGREVRLKYAFYITCTEVIKNTEGEITEILCTYDPETKGGSSPDGRKVKGTLHWVSAEHAYSSEVRLYEHLFTKENPSDLEEGESMEDYLNPNSETILKQVYLEPSLQQSQSGDLFQFERLGYFCVDSVDSKPNQPIFNRTVGLKDSWAKANKKK